MERKTLVQHLRQQQTMAEGATGEFTSLMMEILVAAKFVSLEVNNAGLGENILGLTGRVNIHGEEVQKLDEYSNEIFTKLLGDSGFLCAITSEENDEPVIIPSERAGKYIFMMDPLDGSSNIDVNVSIGTIFSIYQKQDSGREVTQKDLLQKGSQQVAAGYIVYGSSTMFVYSSGNGVHGFTLDPSLGEFFLSHRDIKIPDSGTTYSINEGNIETWEEPQKNLVDYMKETDKATQRPYK
ncbi:MAG: class 1 fructose-bisphosphatase, partial [Nitrospinaceae bacterium]|nr:fructose-1,6-bisphosphatase [Nitrospinaceae bacterium]NIR56696.1 fructose-1,6-bisphosphatase [Nitrospinaceae bacterium]NIS87154.1 fructose-1,6-bisphosphatase [Nitrospinaceae bacterium]NIT84013.1 fructose-1,6-bisphosphatase [Nitrospinaceae bacterium]NIU46205.1 fructose-1,6-bisphosphatase [Nitrospinaceae bacterium]